MRPGPTAGDVARFLSRASDDAACAWLCETAGQRTRQQEDGLGQAVMTLSRGMVASAANPPDLRHMLKRVS